MPSTGVSDEGRSVLREGGGRDGGGGGLWCAACHTLVAGECVWGGARETRSSLIWPSLRAFGTRLARGDGQVSELGQDSELGHDSELG